MDRLNLFHYWHFHILMMNLNLFVSMNLTSHLDDTVIEYMDMNNNLMELLLMD
jgi:hypothetical protein